MHSVGGWNLPSPDSQWGLSFFFFILCSHLQVFVNLVRNALWALSLVNADCCSSTALLTVGLLEQFVASVGKLLGSRVKNNQYELLILVLMVKKVFIKLFRY